MRTNKLILAVFLSISASFNVLGNDNIIVLEEKPSERKIEELKEIDVTTDTIVKHNVKVVDDHMVIQDTILVEKVIEKTEPLIVMYQKKEWGKLIVTFLSGFFVIASIWWNRRKCKKDNK